jgi:5-methyltetrahydropteroyltriglutamate--homocysteine methyltransferase
LETEDQLKRKIDEASRFIPLEQLALSPQCGFSSNIVGNVITEDDQWRKLELVQNLAVQVWGS